MSDTIFFYEGKKYYQDDIEKVLQEVGIDDGDSVFVHSDLKTFGKLNFNINRDKFLNSFIEPIRRTVGSKGNIIMPTFSYSFCRQDVFDPEKTPSEVGVLSEYFRNSEGTVRSIDPIFSVAAGGPRKKYFTDVKTICFGEGSIFEKLHRENTKILFYGDTFDMTYLHYIEQKIGVPYRHIKKFDGKIKIKNNLRNYTFKYYVKPLNIGIEYDLEGTSDFLEKKGALRKAELGHSKVRAVSAVKTFDLIEEKLKENIHFLLKQKPKDKSDYAG